MVSSTDSVPLGSSGLSTKSSEHCETAALLPDDFRLPLACSIIEAMLWQLLPSERNPVAGLAADRLRRVAEGLSTSC